jgi:cytochrome c oxidase cbb3-type subunit 4
MDSSTLVGIVSTVIPLITFLGIVVWAYSRRRKAAFREAANAPFVLPDDGPATVRSDIGRESAK